MVQQPQRDIEEVAIDSLPEMVTELFDSIPNHSSSSSLPISPISNSTKVIPSSQIKLEPQYLGSNTNLTAQTLSPLAINTSTAQQLSSSVSIDTNGNERLFCGYQLNKCYQLTGANNQNHAPVNAIKKTAGASSSNESFPCSSV